MIVYVETNFILQMVLEQEEAGAARGIVDLARARRVRLVLPTAAFPESYWVVTAKADKREVLLTHIHDTYKELSRSTPLQSISDELLALSKPLGEVRMRQFTRFHQLAADLTSIAELLPLDKAALESYADIQMNFGQGMLDSLFLASIKDHMLGEDAKTPKTFISNDKDLCEVARVLFEQRHSCTCIPLYKNALEFIQKRIDR